MPSDDLSDLVDRLSDTASCTSWADADRQRAEAALAISGLRDEVQRLTEENDALRGRERVFLDLLRDAHVVIADIEGDDADEEELLLGVRLRMAKAISEAVATLPGGESCRES